MAEGNKLWGGRFTEQTDAELEKLNASIGYDQRMWREDIQVISLFTISTPKKLID